MTIDLKTVCVIVCLCVSVHIGVCVFVRVCVCVYVGMCVREMKGSEGSELEL